MKATFILFEELERTPRIWPTINIQNNDVLKNHHDQNWKSLQVTSFRLRWEQRCCWMCCLGSFCLADLTVDEKSVTAVAVHGTKIIPGVLYNTYTHFSSLCFVSRGILFSSFKAERQEKMPTRSQKQISEKIYFNRFICISLLAIWDSDFHFSITQMKYIWVT